MKTFYTGAHTQSNFWTIIHFFPHNKLDKWISGQPYPFNIQPGPGPNPTNLHPPKFHFQMRQQIQKSKSHSFFAPLILLASLAIRASHPQPIKVHHSSLYNSPDLSRSLSFIALQIAPKHHSIQSSSSRVSQPPIAAAGK